MISFSCDACAEAYEDGEVNCPYHEAMIFADLRQHGQPSNLEAQHRNGHGCAE